MESIKTFLFSLLVITMMPQMVCADEGNMFYYYTKSLTTPTKMSLDDLDKLTFSSGGIQIWSQNGMNEVPFGDFLLFTFSEIEHPLVTAVESESMPQDMKISFVMENRTLLVESAQPLSGVGVYDIQGRMVDNDTSSSTHYRVSLSHEPKGVYVIKAICNGKMIVKKIVL